MMQTATPRNEGYAELLRAFLAKYDEVEPHINDAFVHRYLRCGQYEGPNFGEELQALREWLKGWDEAKGRARG